MSINIELLPSRLILCLGCCCSFLWLTLPVYGQNGITIRGKIKDLSTYEPLYDAAIGLKGQSIKVYTNFDGEFA